MRNILEVIKQMIGVTNREDLSELLTETLHRLTDGYKNPSDYWDYVHENLFDILDISNLTDNDLEVLSIFTTKSVDELKQLSKTM